MESSKDFKFIKEEISDSFFKKIQINNYNQKPFVQSVIKRHLFPKEVLVKVLKTTIHPSDLMFIKGLYGKHIPNKFPITPGFEGVGIIEDVGKDLPRSLINKYCSIGAAINNNNKKDDNKNISFDGVWTQYYYSELSNLLIYNSKNIDLNIACFALANPLTALSFIEIIKQHKSNLIIQNGSFSSVGKLLIKFCKYNNIATINIVRKDNQIDILKNLGADIVINSENINWQKELINNIKKFTNNKNENVIGFDCVGGDMTFKLFKSMPSKSTLYHYGNLEIKKMNGLDSSDLIFDDKTLKGFWLNTYLENIDINLKKKIYSNLKYMIEDRNKNYLIENSINKEYELEDINNAIKEYVLNMNKGKIIIKPNF